MDSPPIDSWPLQASPKPGQPRVRIRLNGQWDVQPATESLIPQEWHHTVQVPGLVDGAEPSYEVQAYDFHWYRTSFDLPPESTRPTARLVLEQAMFGTEVWLNGRRLVGDADPAPLYARRKDPVVQRYFFNLLSWAAVPRGGKH
jgi:hypothetical protein